MRIFLLLILLFSINVSAAECEYNLTEEQENKINSAFSDLSITQQFAFVGSLSAIRKSVFEEGALVSVLKIDEELEKRVWMILRFLESDQHADLDRIIGALELFFEDNSYYTFKWTDEQLKSIKAQMYELSKVDV